MSQPFVGEIRVVPYTFAPQGWAYCDGSLLSISQNDVLFNLIGTTYGGDGVNTFALPDLRGRVPVGTGTNIIGHASGQELTALSFNQMPTHDHSVAVSSSAASDVHLASHYPGRSARSIYAAATTESFMSAGSISPTGSNQPHENRQPYLGISYIISLFGIYPSQ